MKKEKYLFCYFAIFAFNSLSASFSPYNLKGEWNGMYDVYCEYKKVKNDISGSRELFFEVEKGNIESAITLLLKGADPNTRNVYHSVLHIAVEKGSMELIKSLIEKGANVNVIDNGGHTPLFYAIRKNDFKMIELLESNGAK